MLSKKDEQQVPSHTHTFNRDITVVLMRNSKGEQGEATKNTEVGGRCRLFLSTKKVRLFTISQMQGCSQGCLPSDSTGWKLILSIAMALYHSTTPIGPPLS